MDEPRHVGTSWVVRETGLDPTTIKRAAAKGLVPGATKLLGRWRYDPVLIRAWIEAGRPKPQTSEPTRVMAEPSRSTPKPDHQRGAVQAAHPGTANLPPLVVLFPDAPWRGIYPEIPATPRPTASRRSRARKTAVSAN